MVKYKMILSRQTLNVGYDHICSTRHRQSQLPGIKNTGVKRKKIWPFSLPVCLLTLGLWVRATFGPFPQMITLIPGCHGNKLKRG